jgi:peptidoglycan/xylan/chitin deacetylase (PgdA/CDA1 family)
MADIPTRLGVLEYHDIVSGRPDASGFPGPSAASYKVDHVRFASHLEQLARVGPVVLPADGRHAPAQDAILVTFDDGGVDALRVAAPLLESHGMRGIFFMTTGMIGRPGFLDEDQLRELAQRGHAIGSHSVTHPARFSALAREEMLREWRESRAALEQVLGAEVRLASVPGGYHSAAAAATAAEAGIRWLFTSEPSARVTMTGDCAVVGRFTLRRGSSPAQALAFATGRGRARGVAAVTWTGKKLLKRVAGPAYLRVRRIAFGDA